MTEVPSKPARRRRWWKYLLFLFLLALILLGAASWYMTTDSFQAYVRRRIVSAMEEATGARVELGTYHTIPFRLQAEIRDFTLHGLEGPDQIPLAHVDSVVARIKIISLLETSFGFKSIVLDHPVIDLIVYPDGSAYRFTYEPTTTTSVDAPSNVPVTTGRLASVTLPTGGTVSYAYTGGYNCALWTPLGLTRATSDGDTTIYTRMLTGTGSGAQLGLAFWQTTVENALTKRIVNFAATSQGPSFDVHGVIAGSA